MDLKKKWQSYLSNLQPGDDIEIEHLEFASSPNNTADRILCLYKESSDKYILSVQVPSILASANDYPNPEPTADLKQDIYQQLELFLKHFPSICLCVSRSFFHCF